MKTKRELTVKIVNKEGWCVRVNEQGVFQHRENDAKHSKKLFNFTKQISIQLIKTELNNGNYQFIVKLTEDTLSVNLFIQNKESLEQLYILLGKNSVIKGLNDVGSDFTKIGQGSFATVFQITTHYETTFALKSFEKKEINDNQKTKKAFRNQILLMKSLNNPHIVSYDYIYETEKTFYLKMEYFPKCLRDKLSGKILIKHQKNMMKQLLTALLQMKNKGIIHRDLKPDNVMIRVNSKGEDECVIIDFGLGTFTDSLPYLFTRCGTPGFLSPEIANLADKNEQQHCSSDMFSLGCIFYKILTGHYLFPGKTAKQVLVKNRKCDYSQYCLEDLTQKQKDLLLKMIEINPKIRITPEQALQHTYFEQQIDDADQIFEEGHPMQNNIRKITNFSPVKNMDSIRSSLLLQSANFLRFTPRHDHKNSIRDSCLSFQVGTDSIQTYEEPKTNRSFLTCSSKTPSKFRPTNF